MPERVAIDLAGEELILTGHPAVLWPARATAFVADVHLGKSAAFRAAGVPVPEHTTGTDLARLSALVHESGAERLVVLGDLVHARAWLNPATLGAVERWRERHAPLALACVRGNHDRRAGPLPPHLAIEELDEPARDGPLTLAHEPDRAPGVPALAGHLHPVARLASPRGAGAARAPCFWRRGATLILPAFGSFTGGHSASPTPGDALWATRRGVVVPVNLVENPRESGRRTPLGRGPSRPGTRESGPAA